MKARATAEGVLALALALAVLATAAVFGSDRGGDADPRASTHNDDRRGAHALLLVLGELGLAAGRSVDPPRADAPTDRTLVVLAPSWAVTRGEAADLLDWVADGGRLVVVDAPSAPPLAVVDVDVLLHPLGLETRPASGAARGVRVVPAEWDRAVRGQHWPARLVLAERTGAARDERAGTPEPLVDAAEGALAFRVPFGEGEVVAVADEGLFVNENLGKEDGAVLAALLLADPRRPRIDFDEFHHGYTATGTRAGVGERIAALLVGTWIGRALLLVAVAGLVHAAGAAVRLGAPLPQAAPSRRALREHADALGRLLEAARASREALEVLTAGVRRACATRAGFAAGAAPAEFRRRLERSLAPGAKELAAAMDAAESAAARPSVKDVDLARIAATLAAAKRRFLHGGS